MWKDSDFLGQGGTGIIIHRDVKKHSFSNPLMVDSWFIKPFFDGFLTITTDQWSMSITKPLVFWHTRGLKAWETCNMKQLVAQCCARGQQHHFISCWQTIVWRCLEHALMFSFMACFAYVFAFAAFVVYSLWSFFNPWKVASMNDARAHFPHGFFLTVLSVVVLRSLEEGLGVMALEGKKNAHLQWTGN